MTKGLAADHILEYTQQVKERGHYCCYTLLIIIIIIIADIANNLLCATLTLFICVIIVTVSLSL